jgi:sigma-B regulation protein RsbU (phosphoserine phosphatase)
MHAPLAHSLKRLSGFEGELAEGFRVVAGLLAERSGSQVQALLLYGQPLRVAALAGASEIPLRDPINQSDTLPAFDDLLSQSILEGNSESPFALALEDGQRTCALGKLLAQPKKLVVLPLFDAGILRHYLALGFSEENTNTALCFDSLMVLAHAAVGLTRGQIRERTLTQARDAVLHEIHDLKDVQRALLPDAPNFHGLRYAVHYQPSALVGGDYYDLSRLSHRNPQFQEGMRDVVGAIIADVSGHGAGAAMEAVQFDAILRTYRGDGGDGPAAALSYANRHFFSRRSRGHFMTALAMLFLPHLALVRFVSAGHPGFFHWHQGSWLERGSGSDIPIGVLRDYQFENQLLRYQPGDRFVLFTDGIFEARNQAGIEFGRERIRQLLDQYAHASIEEIKTVLIEALHVHQGSDTGKDDQTLLVLEIEADHAALEPP